MHLAEATWTDVADAETDLALVPTGSTEQHGPHAPLGTDRIAAEAVARAGAEAHERDHGDPVVVAPAVPVGVSEEHRQFPGSLWVDPETFRSYVRETVRGLAAHGFDRVVLVNGHGGNVDPLREVAAAITRHDAAYAVPFTWFDHVDGPPMGHAGPRETALLRSVAPDLVREDRTATAAEGGADRWGDWVEGVNLAYDVAEFSENGVVGDPRVGDPEGERPETGGGDGTDEARDGETDRPDAATGDRLLASAAESLSALLAAVADRSPQRDDG